MSGLPIVALLVLLWLCWASPMVRRDEDRWVDDAGRTGWGEEPEPDDRPTLAECAADDAAQARADRTGDAGWRHGSADPRWGWPS